MTTTVLTHCKHLRANAASIGGYHPHGLASILTGLESIEHVLDMLGRHELKPVNPPTCLPGTSEGVA
ncbi:hypothetical protein TNCV_3339151 [Trichonephila clavipes]|nr:hypothetical protein TNCV_3339151 [Trichonephila clavipes]